MPDQTISETTPRLSPRAIGRDYLAAATLWLPVVVIAVTAALWYDQLPAALPRQWSGAEVTSTSGTTAWIVVTGGIALLGALAGLVSLVDAAAGIRRGLLLAAGFAAGMCAGAWLMSAGLVLATGSPEPDAGGWPLLAMLAGAYGFIPFALSPRRPLERGPHSPVSVPLGESETGAWFTVVNVPMFLWLSGILAVATAGTAVLSIMKGGASAGVAITLAVVTVACLAFARVQVSVDRRGLRVMSSLLHVPLRNLRLDQIVSARAETIVPMEWGGWGYRVMPGRSAIVVAGGPGIVVERTNGTLFAVTVPDAELPAALLTTLVGR